jgi:hypothetical protein
MTDLLKNIEQRIFKRDAKIVETFPTLEINNSIDYDNANLIYRYLIHVDFKEQGYCRDADELEVLRKIFIKRLKSLIYAEFEVLLAKATYAAYNRNTDEVIAILREMQKEVYDV